MNPQILVVEDDEAIAALIKQVLELEKYHVVFAANGQEALNYLKAKPHPDLILLDLTMPVMDGLEFRKRQLQDRSLSHIPVLLMTADSQISRAAAELKISETLKKPLIIDNVLSKVRVALGAKLK